MQHFTLPLIKNSAGKPDGLFTMSWIAFGIWCVHAVVLGLFGGSKLEVATGPVSGSWTVPEFSWASLSGILPLIAGYIARRHQLGAKGEPSKPDGDGGGNPG